MKSDEDTLPPDEVFMDPLLGALALLRWQNTRNPYQAYSLLYATPDPERFVAVTQEGSYSNGVAEGTAVRAQPGAWVGCSGQSLRQHRPQIVCRDDAHDHLAIAQGLGRMVEDRFVVLATDEDREQFVARYNLRHASD